MKVTEHLDQANGKTLISYEILPPVKGKQIRDLYQHLDPLMEFQPSFVNVTYHRAEEIYRQNESGSFDRIEIRKRPGTVGICAALMNHYHVDPVPHLICGGFNREDTENALIDLHYLGIHNVLALRGDAARNEKFFRPRPFGYEHAEELVAQIADLNRGIYIEPDIEDGVSTDFCIGVAGYPEKHMESANPEFDIQQLKNKVDKGAAYITTQMFFDNAHYFDFVDRCRKAGITVPVIPGLKPITTRKQLSILPSVFHVDIPAALTNAMLACRTREDMKRVGTEWLIGQCRELLQHKVPVLHFYTLGQSEVIRNTLHAIL